MGSVSRSDRRLAVAYGAVSAAGQTSNIVRTAMTQLREIPHVRQISGEPKRRLVHIGIP